MNERNKAFLAAMLAVKRGLLDADAAVELLAEIDKDDAAAKPDAVAPVLSIACASIASPALEAEVEAIVADPIVAQRTLIELGCDEPLAQSLVEFGASISPDQMRRTLFQAAESASARTFNTTTLTSLVDRERYEMRREHGRGGMGVVYLAFDKSLDREVAYKRLLPRKASSGRHSPMTPASNPAETVERFLREAKVTGQLEHPNIIPVYEIGERDQGEVYYTMKFVRGRSMADRLREIQGDGALSDAEKLAERLKLIDAFVDVCNAVAYAHSKGVIHRDLKPDNIMLGGFGETLLVDWGLAQVKGVLDSLPAQANLSIAGSVSDNDSANSRLTMDGAVIGTPAYMSPEQAKGELADVDERSDVYSLGAILYEIISGQAPIQGRTIQKLLASASLGERASLHELVPDAPGELVAIVDFAMQLAPDKRPQDADALASEVIAWRDGGRVSAYEYSSWELLKRFAKRNRAALVAATVLVVAVLGFLLVDYWQEEEAFQQALAERKSTLTSLEQAAMDSNAGSLLISAKELVVSGELFRTSYIPDRPVPDSLTIQETTPDAEILSDLPKRMLAASSKIDLWLNLASQSVADRVVVFMPETQRAWLSQQSIDLRLLAAKIEALNGGYRLADQILDQTPASHEVLLTARRFIADQRTATQHMQRLRIEFAINDVEQGLSREGRQIAHPTLDEYASELSGFRHKQTVDLLGDKLRSYADLCRAHWESSESEQGDTTLFVWTPEQRQVIRLCAEVLSRINMGSAAALAMAPLAEVARDQEIIVAVGKAICLTRSEEGRQIVSMIMNRNLPTGINAALTPFLRCLPLPPMSEVPGFDDYFRRGLARNSIGDYVGAIKNFTQALSFDGASVIALNSRAAAYSALRRFDDALADLGAAIELDPTASKPVNARGLVYREMGNVAAELADFKRAVELNPASTDALNNLAVSHIYSGQHAVAIPVLDKAIAIDGTDSRSYTHRAVARRAIGELDAAMEDASRAIALDPHNEYAFSVRAHIKRNLKDHEGSVEDYTRAIELNPRNATTVAARGALFHDVFKRFEDAYNDFVTAISLDPRSPMNYMNLGIAQWSLHRHDEAIASWDRALAIDPEYADCLVMKGARLHSVGRVEEAITVFKRLYEVDPEHSVVSINLAICYRASHDYVEAAKWYSRVVQSATRQDLLADARASLSRMQAYAAIRPWITREAVRPQEHLLKSRANVTFSDIGLDGATLTAAMEHYSIVERAWSDASTNNAAMKEITSLRISLASANYRAKSYRVSAELYREALKKPEFVEDVVNNAYNAACSAALVAEQLATGENPDRDEIHAWVNQAFSMLEAAIGYGYSGHEHASQDPDLTVLRDDPRWTGVVEAVRVNAETAAAAKAEAERIAILVQQHINQGMVHMRAGDADKAEREWNSAVELDSRNETALNNRGFARWKQGKHEAGLEDYRKCFELAPTGKSAFRAAFLAALASTDRSAQNPGDQLAGTLIDEAFTWLDKAIELGHSELASVETNKDFTALHADPRWAKILDRIKANAEKAPDGK